MTKNSVSKKIDDGNFLLFMLNNENVQEYLAKHNVDVNALDMFAQAKISANKKLHSDFKKSEITFNEALDIDAFFGKILYEEGDNSGFIEFLEEMVICLESAYNFSNKNSSKYHLFSLMDDKMNILRRAGLTYDNVCMDKEYENRIKAYENKDFKFYGKMALEDAMTDDKNKISKAKNEYKEDEFLMSVGAKDLTAIAKCGMISPIFDRDKEIATMKRILTRMEKQNIIVTGLAGVGKTSLVEGLAQEIVAGNVPAKLKNKKIISLDLNAMKSGTNYRGMLEQKIQDLIGEVRSTNSILFIDEDRKSVV